MLMHGFSPEEHDRDLIDQASDSDTSDEEDIEGRDDVEGVTPRAVPMGLAESVADEVEGDVKGSPIDKECIDISPEPDPYKKKTIFDYAKWIFFARKVPAEIAGGNFRKSCTK